MQGEESAIMKIMCNLKLVSEKEVEEIIFVVVVN